MSASDDTEPVDIRYDNGNQRLEVTWSDDRETVYGDDPVQVPLRRLHWRG